jgi:hypothetical protein
MCGVARETSTSRCMRPCERMAGPATSLKKSCTTAVKSSSTTGSAPPLPRPVNVEYQPISTSLGFTLRCNSYSSCSVCLRTETWARRGNGGGRRAQGRGGQGGERVGGVGGGLRGRGGRGPASSKGSHHVQAPWPRTSTSSMSLWYTPKASVTSTTPVLLSTDPSSAPITRFPASRRAWWFRSEKITKGCTCTCGCDCEGK